MPSPRRVIFLMTDTQRWDMVNCYRQTGLQTPHLDRLAAGGLRFEHAYTCQPVCGPARAALFTGTWPHLNGGWTNCVPLGANFPTIGKRLTDQGVHCAYIGKWHLDGSDYFGTGIPPEGWDPKYWYDMRRYLEELTPEERVRSRRAPNPADGDVAPEFTYGHRCSNRAIDFLKNHGQEDFFLSVSYDEPHGPFLCPQRYVDMYKSFEFPKSPNVWDRLEDKPEHQRAWAGAATKEDKDSLRIMHPAYFGCNTFVDEEIGRVIDAIDRYAPDALVIYTSDHGDLMTSHSMGNKGAAMYDEITRIPLIVRWPGQTPAGAVGSAGPVSHIDMVPTILDCFGLPVPKSVDGQSLVPTLRDPSRRPSDVVFMEFGRYEADHDGFGGFQPIRAGFDGRYKLVINLLTSDEFYDLQTDPGEMKSLIDSPAHGAIRNQLHDRVLEWMNQTRDPFRGYYWERRPWRSDAGPATWDYTLMTRQREFEEYEPRQLDYGTGLPMKDATRLKG